MTDYEFFCAIAKIARTTRTEADALDLLELYAESGCATYPVDAALFRELWADEKPPGFVLRAYSHLNGFTVAAVSR